MFWDFVLSRMALYGPIWSCRKVEKLGKICIIGKIGKLRKIGNLGNKMCLGKIGNLRDIVQIKRHVMCKKNRKYAKIKDTKDLFGK